MKVLDAGLLTTVQDLGRTGYQKVGVPVSGAMDIVALRVANALVGNEEEAAALEITLQGPTLELEADALIAACGAELEATIADVPVPSWRAILVAGGSTVSLGRTTSRCRSYLAVAGGIDVPKVMGSRSTHLLAGIGGHEGRALRGGDRVRVGSPSSRANETMVRAAAQVDALPFALSDRYVDPASLDVYEPPDEVRFVAGPHFDLLDEQDRRTLSTEMFRVSTRSDRMGYRLEGAGLASARSHDLISSAVVAGTIQVPPDGHPIVLMADRQTTGGYPMVAQVIAVDLPRVAQLKPGDPVTFRQISLDRAQDLLRVRNRRLQMLRKELEAGGKDRP